jgi:Ubiquitin-binding domain
LENARVVVEAAGVTLPTGSLVDGGYDAWGGLYRIPKEVCSDPTNVVNEEEGDGETIVGSAPAALIGLKGKGAGDGEAGAGSEMGDREQKKRRDEKGKGKAVLDKDAVRVKCRLSDRGGPDVIIMLGKSQSVGVLTTRVIDEADVSTSLLLLFSCQCDMVLIKCDVFRYQIQHGYESPT